MRSMSFTRTDTSATKSTSAHWLSSGDLRKRLLAPFLILVVTKTQTFVYQDKLGTRIREHAQTKESRLILFRFLLPGVIMQPALRLQDALGAAQVRKRVFCDAI